MVKGPTLTHTERLVLRVVSTFGLMCDEDIHYTLTRWGYTVTFEDVRLASLVLQQMGLIKITNDPGSCPCYDVTQKGASVTT